MGTRYEFLPGRGSHYSGKIRSFVLRNKKVRKRGIRANKLPESPEPGVDQQLSPLADGRSLLRGALDPFQTMAARVSPIENEMLYHYVEACIPNLGRRSPGSFFPPRDIDWGLIRTDESLMSAAVQFAAMSLMYVESTPGIRFFAEQARARTLQLLRRKLDAEGMNPSDALLHTFIGVIATDTHIRQPTQPQYGAHKPQDNVHLHIKGLRAAMKARHGWKLNLYHAVLQFEFIWQDIVSNGEISALDTTISSHIERMLPPNAVLPSGPTLEDHWERLCLLEFIGAYTNFYEMATVRLSTKTTSQSSVPEPRDLCLPGTAAYKTMKSDIVSVVRPTAAIILFNIMLYGMRGSIPEELTYQYWALRRKFRLCDVELGSGSAYLVYALGMTPDMKVWADQDQVALLARMLSVEVRLSQPTQRRLKDSLLSFFSASTMLEAKTWWMPDVVYTQLNEELPED